MGGTGSAAQQTARPAATGRRGAVVAALMLSMAPAALDSTIFSTASARTGSSSPGAATRA